MSAPFLFLSCSTKMIVSDRVSQCPDRCTDAASLLNRNLCARKVTMEQIIASGPSVGVAHGLASGKTAARVGAVIRTSPAASVNAWCAKGAGTIKPLAGSATAIRGFAVLPIAMGQRVFPVDRIVSSQTTTSNDDACRHAPDQK